jgi:hypothetical protein
MNKRVEAIIQENEQKGQFYKMILNASYGYDGLNTEKLNTSNSIVRYKKEQQLVCRKEFVNTEVLMKDNENKNNSVYRVEMRNKSFDCKTCLQEAFFTLDNSKTWFLIFLYRFLFKCIDKETFHFSHSDTDSFYMAIAGDLNLGCHQGLEAVIKDKQFWNENKYKFLPDPNGDMYENKKLLGCSVEHESDVEISLS